MPITAMINITGSQGLDPSLPASDTSLFYRILSDAKEFVQLLLCNMMVTPRLFGAMRAHDVWVGAFAGQQHNVAGARLLERFAYCLAPVKHYVWLVLRKPFRYLT
ncbi:MAG: hypothetical protein QG621_323, partial [Patescibacteria group bacterium]|nr:hypothetical protein [Patescibacteria group bacterium]